MFSIILAFEILCLVFSNFQQISKVVWAHRWAQTTFEICKLILTHLNNGKERGRFTETVDHFIL